MDKRIFFSQEYIALLVNYYQEYLDNEPIIRLNSGDTCPRIREYDRKSHATLHQYKLNTEEGKQLLDRYERNCRVKQLVDQYKTLWEITYHIPIPVIDRHIMQNLSNLDWNGSTIQLYDKLMSEQSNGIFERKYLHNQGPAASMLEMTVANVLDELCLNYKHEPLISLGNDNKLVDFYIAVPFINFAFPTEVAGMLSNESYYDKYQTDMRKYYRAGFIAGENLLILTSSDLFNVSNENIAMKICNFINEVVHYAIARAKNM